MLHRMRDHHEGVDVSEFSQIDLNNCICGATMNDPLHGQPPCEWCDGALLDRRPPSVWRRLWWRIACRYLLGKDKG